MTTLPAKRPSAAVQPVAHAFSPAIAATEWLVGGCLLSTRSHVAQVVDGRTARAGEAQRLRWATGIQVRFSTMVRVPDPAKTLTTALSPRPARPAARHPSSAP